MGGGQLEFQYPLLPATHTRENVQKVTSTYYRAQHVDSGTAVDVWMFVSLSGLYAETSYSERQAIVQPLRASSRPLMTHEIKSFSTDSRETDSPKTKDCRRGLETGPSACWGGLLCVSVHMCVCVCV